MILTAEQQAAVEAIEGAIGKRELFVLHGLAGTGKTTVAAHVATGWPSARLCAPTGKAASVLGAKTGLPATTVHAAFYDFVQRGGEGLVFAPRWAPGALRGEVALIDECNMVQWQMARDVLATGVTVIAIGDPGQLPPVSGVPFFSSADFTLRQVQRQALLSPIVRQAHAVRAGRPYQGDGDGFRVSRRVMGEDLLAADIVLTGRRWTRSRVNELKRHVLGIEAPLPRAGEPMVCLKNSPMQGLYNGAIYVAARDLQERDKCIGIRLDNGEEIEVEADFLGPGREDEAFEKSGVAQWKMAFAFGYALTVHKAQGSEWDRVLLIDEWGGQGVGRAQWLYTGITRATREIMVVPMQATG